MSKRPFSALARDCAEIVEIAQQDGARGAATQGKAHTLSKSS